jgi:hypothetical protein
MSVSQLAHLALLWRHRAKACWALLLIASTGCATGAGLQDAQYCITNKTRAEVSWLTSSSWSCRRELGSDYGAGYKRGYYDASTGRDCRLPAVPPPCYWSTEYQSCEGQVCIQAWYRGYQCGADAARADGHPAFNTIPVGPCSPTVNVTGCQGCTSDRCSCSQCSTGNCQERCNHEFHGGLFGQYGSELMQLPPTDAPEIIDSREVNKTLEPTKTAEPEVLRTDPKA